ncbi:MULTISPECIES: YhjD/YihY/BrkB family envelope integrity protein [Methylosinus]|uniref:YihY/virulence factor BrkB family protein n=1 Tax=Methylosinus trichosporium (strain ATCC 35070 / NCIMB 11131 / UNIQEM 75 / OB3b) TaxID=595536 RepID=A0A2D2CXC6_METT3|nr:MULTISPECIES: YhjD/YihY/BrkB family envelope integrity protein [Methylosinus]ATQ67401.1 hypothetical protein CQW49_05445 [Methylosinus trichosporium OB3b]OBS51586.1 hypothetical protein A8B73_15345 [Methylosinus sp. 3S-1]
MTGEQASTERAEVLSFDHPATGWRESLGRNHCKLLEHRTAAIAAGVSFYALLAIFFNETYGALGAVIALMLWMWVSTIVLLVGAELDVEMERRRAGARDDSRKRL